MDRLVGGDVLQGLAHGLRGGKELAVANPGERVARREFPRRLSEQGAEIQAARLIVNSGGWRSVWATTQ